MAKPTRLCAIDIPQHIIRFGNICIFDVSCEAALRHSVGWQGDLFRLFDATSMLVNNSGVNKCLKKY